MGKEGRKETRECKGDSGHEQCRSFACLEIAQKNLKISIYLTSIIIYFKGD